MNSWLSVGFDAFSPSDARTTGFYYGGGSNTYVDIKGTDGAVFHALDFLLGNGEAPPTTNLQWQTFLYGSLTGSGFQSVVTKGVTVGWTDATGFDVLRVAASGGAAVGAFSPNYHPGFGNFQSIALDDVRAQLGSAPPPCDTCNNPPPVQVPEPETYPILLVGLGLLGFMARRRKQQAA